ncbi:MAG: acyl-CoA dehydrogenase [Archangium sp.]
MIFRRLLTEVGEVAGDSIERAILGGARSDRLGLAFIAGYSAAITVLDPSIRELGALCATEAGGGHPRAIQTTLSDGVLNGTKGFVSGGRLAKQLLVVAKVGEVDGRPALKVARIRADAPGVEHTDGIELDFIPEVPHGTVTFTNARVDAVLEGDGYEKYLKPFRTIEDLHVFGAVLGCLVHNGRKVLAQDVVERLLAQLASIITLARQSPSDEGTHLALAGVIASSRTLIDSLDMSAFDSDFRTRFERDRKLLNIASKVREARRQKAWSSLE